MNKMFLSLKKNKKADIAVTLFVICIIILMMSALLSFYTSQNKDKSEFRNIADAQNLYNNADSTFSTVEKTFYLKDILGIERDVSFKIKYTPEK